MGDSRRRSISNDDFADDDQSALAWAASTGHPVAVATVIRLRDGADASLSVAELDAMPGALRRVLTGTPSHDALTWVRTHYCYKAVETDVQEQLVVTFPPPHANPSP